MPIDRTRWSRPGSICPGTLTVYLARILLICRTRNTYGYNSACMRIFRLILDGIRRDRKVKQRAQSGVQRRINPLPHVW
jgi:hypothetical protein